jgi:seryl-tRNA synthetase
MTDLTALAIKLAVQERDVLEDEIVDLDSSVAQTNQRLKDLEAERNKVAKDHDFQWQMRQTKVSTRERLDILIRDLKRNRAGFPWLSNEEYEARMQDARQEIQELIELS